MSKSKKNKKPKRQTAAEVNASVGSPTLLAARLRGGAGIHKQRPTRSAERRAAIKEHS